MSSRIHNNLITILLIQRAVTMLKDLTEIRQRNPLMRLSNLFLAISLACSSYAVVETSQESTFEASKYYYLS